MLINWLKRLFRASVIGNIISFLTLAVTLLVAISQYFKDNSLEVSPVLFNKEFSKDTINNIIFTTDDTIKLSNCQFVPSLKNISKYPICDIIIDYSLVKPLSQKDPLIFFYINKKYEYVDYKFRDVGHNKTCLVQTYRTKIPRLYPNETTQLYLDSCYILPSINNKEHSDFLFEINISWDGMENKKFVVYNKLFGIESFREKSTSYNDSLVFFEPHSWISSALYKTKDELCNINKNCNFFFFYHSYRDKIIYGNPSYGTSKAYYNINSNNIDIDHNMYSSEWQCQHDFSYESKEFKRNVIEYDIVITFLGFIVFALLVGTLINYAIEVFKNKTIFTDSLTSVIGYLIVSFASLSRWLYCKDIISPLTYNFSKNFTLISLIICIVCFINSILLVLEEIDELKRNKSKQKENTDESETSSPLVYKLVSTEDVSEKEKTILVYKIDSTTGKFSLGPIIFNVVVAIFILVLCISSYFNMEYINEHIFKYFFFTGNYYI